MQKQTEVKSLFFTLKNEIYEVAYTLTEIVNVQKIRKMRKKDCILKKKHI